MGFVLWPMSGLSGFWWLSAHLRARSSDLSRAWHGKQREQLELPSDPLSKGACSERGCPERGCAERGCPERGCPERGARKGVTQKGVARKGVTRKGVARKGVARKGVTLKGVTHKGVARKGVTQKGVARKGVTQKGEARKGWLRVQAGDTAGYKPISLQDPLLCGRVGAGEGPRDSSFVCVWSKQMAAFPVEGHLERPSATPPNKRKWS